MRGVGRRWLRATVILVFAALVSSAATSSASAAQLTLPALHLPSVAQIEAWLRGAAGWVLPSQESGSAAGKSHNASSASTRSGSGNGRAPGHGKGALGAYTPVGAKTVPGVSGLLRKGFDPKTSTRVAAKSTATSTWYQNADGTVTRKVSETPVNYRTTSGDWLPIDASLTRAPSGRLVNRANSFAVSFAGGASGARARIGATQPELDATASPSATASAGELAAVNLSSTESFGWSLSGAAPVAPTVSGDTATYSQILPGTTLALSSESYGIKESLILSSPSAGHSWTFPLSMSGVSLSQRSDGTWNLLDSSGHEVAYLSAPFAYDSNLNTKSGAPAETQDVSYKLATVGGVQQLTMTLSPSWLADPSRVFPVTVDPTVSVSIAGQTATTYVSTLCTIGCNHSSDTLLQTGYDQTQIARSFYMFPASGMANTGWHVTAAQFAGFLTHAWNTASSYAHVHVNPVGGTWTVNASYCWTKNQSGNTCSGSSLALPSIGSPIETGGYTEGSSTTCSIGGTSTSGNWTYTALGTTPFNAWSTNGTAYYGLALSGYSETDANYWKIFASSQNSACSPYVSLTYSQDASPQINSMSPTSGSALATLTPTLVASGSDPDSWPNSSLQYQFAVYPGAGGSPIASSSWQAGFTWSVPSGLLKWGQTYQWRVQAYDGDGASNGVGYSAVSYYSFTTSAPPPLLTGSLSQNTDGHGYSAAIGNYTTRAVDAKIATVGPALQVERDYNSLDPRSSQGFGAGWSSIVDARITQVLDTSGNILEAVITYPNGSQVPFGRNSDGTYSPPLGQYATLTYDSVALGYTLTDKAGTTYWFGHPITPAATGAAGVYGLSWMRDREQHTVEISYTASPGGQVQEIYSDTSHRDLWFVWSTPSAAKNPHVSDVYTNDAVSGDSTTQEHWKYTYTGDQLTSVCDSASHCTGYSYDPGSQYPNAVLDSAPASYWRLGESSGTAAASSVLANEQSDAGTYSNVTLGSAAGAGPFASYGNTSTAASFNGSSSYVALPNGLLPGQSYLSIALWFNTKTTGPLFCVQNTALTTTPGNAMCPLFVGSDGYLHGAFYTGSNTGIVGNKTVTDGAWHLAVLSGSATTQSLYLDGSLVNSLSGTINNLSMSYGYLGAVYSKPGWAGAPSTTGNWYFNGQIADVAVYQRGLTATEAANLNAIGTSSASLLKKVTTPTTAVAAQVTYNQATGRVQSVTDENGGNWGISAPTVAGSSEVFRSAVLGTAPRGYWRLGESAGASTAANQLNEYVGTYNDVTLGAHSVFSDVTAGSFGGSDSYVKTSGPVLDTSIGFSVSAWANLTTANGFEDVVTKDATQNSSFELQYDATTKSWAFSRSVADSSSATIVKAIDPTAVQTGTWYLLTGTYDPASGKMSLYVNGSLVATATDTTPYSSLGSLEIGRGQFQGSAGEYFNGTIGDVAAYQSVLDPQQVANLYRAAKNSTGIAPMETVTVTDPGNNTLTYRFDPENGYRLIASTDGRGYTTTYGYDTAGFLHTTTDPNGNVTTTDQDVRGNMVSKTTCQVTATNACSTQFWTYYPDDTTAILTPSSTSGEYDLPLTYTDSRASIANDVNFTTKYVYDANGNRKQVTTPPVSGYPSGRTTTTTYTDGTSVLAYGSTSVYAPAGLPYKVTTPGNAVTTTLYDATGDVARVTDPLGKTTTYTYDLLGRVLTKTVGWSSTYSGTTTASSAVTSYTYYTDGLIHTETDPVTTDAVTGYTHQKFTTYTYNEDGDTTSVVVADNGTGADPTRTTLMTHYNGQLVSVTDPAGHKTLYTYDSFGRKATVTDPVGNVTSYSYDADGNLQTTVLKNYIGDPVNPSSPADLTQESRAYDPAGRLAQVIDAMGRITKYTYTDNNLTATVTKTDPTGTSSFVTEADSYDAAGNLLKKVTNGGATETDYAVDAANRVIKTTVDPAGIDRVTTNTYFADDYLATQTVTAGSNSIVTGYTYDANGNVLTKSISGDGTTRTSTWTRDTRGLAETLADALSNTTTYFYDALGQQTEEVQPSVLSETYSLATLSPTQANASPTTLIGYDTFGDKAETQDPVGNVTKYTYYGDGRVQYITGAAYTPIGSSTAIIPVETRTYDADGRIKTDLSPGNRLTAHTYDQLGDVATTTDPRGGVTHSTYDTDREKLSSTDPGGTVTGATYDFMGHTTTTSVVESALSATLTTTYVYGPGGWLKTQTTPAGVSTAYTYDALGEKLTDVDGASKTTTYTYDGLGHLIRTLAPDGTLKTSTFDALGDVTGTAAYNINGVLQSSTSATYDKLGHKKTATNALTYTTAFDYDATGLLIDEVQPVTSSVSITMRFRYDLAGNKTEQFVDGMNDSTFWVYNALGRMDATVAPAVGSYTAAVDRATTYVYDADGDVTSETLPGGVGLGATYDANGDMLTQFASGTGADATTATRTMTYDADGNMLTATTSNTSGTSTSNATSEAYTYDSEGDLRTVTGSAGASSFTYTPDALMATRTDAAGTTTYTYDSADRLSTLADPLTGTAATYTYNTMSQPATITYGTGGDVRSYSYDALHRVILDKLSTAGGAQVKAISYVYDAENQLTSKTDQVGVTNTYVYDEAGRLSTWSNGTTSTSYGYDAASNRTNITTTNIATGGVTSNVTNNYDARDELYSSSDSVSSASAVYTYTARGTLASASATTSSGSSVTASTFDAYGQQVTHGAVTYNYDALGRMLTGTTSTASNTLQYSGVGNTPAADGSDLYTHTPDDTPYATSILAGAGRVLWLDQHGDAVGDYSTTSTGLQGTQSFDPLGIRLSATGNATALNLGYQGGYTDPSTGQVDMAARWYNPSTGQFASSDTQQNNPVPDTAAANPYGYADGSPLNGTDPSGHITVGGSGDGPVCTPLLSPWCIVINSVTDNDTASCDTTTCQCDRYQKDCATICTSDPTDIRCNPPSWDDDPCAGLSGPACAQKYGNRPTWPNTNNPKTGPSGGPFSGCDAACQAKRWLDHIKALSRLGHTAISFTVGAAADADAALNSAASALASTVVGLGIGVATVLTNLPGNGNDDNNDQSCDPLPSSSPNGHITYLPLERAPGTDECRATGAYGQLNRDDYRDFRLDPTVTPPGYSDLPAGLAARGHLIANVLGGTPSDLRNFVPLYQDANLLMYNSMEKPVRDRIKRGLSVDYIVTPEYGGPNPLVPSAVRITAVGGGLNETCTITNQPVPSESCDGGTAPPF